MKEKSVTAQIEEIHQMMQKSTRFMSLSGMSSVIVGFIALVASTIVFFLQNKIDFVIDLSPSKIPIMFFLAIATMICSLGVGFWFAYKKSQRKGEQFFTKISLRFLWSFALPLLVGGLFCVILLYQRNLLLLSPATMIFYGLALFNSSAYSYENIKYLAYIFILGGLLNCILVGAGLFIWAGTFGLAHIIYGFYFHLKVENK